MLDVPIPPADSSCLNRTQARARALEAGFTEAGVVALPHAGETRDAARFEEWVRAGRAGTMSYLERTAEDGRLLRARTGTPFPWARSAIVCMASYDSRQPRSINPARGSDPALGSGTALGSDPALGGTPTPGGAAWIARYAWSSRRDADGAPRSSDYHKVLLKRLRALEARLHGELGAFEARAYVDTGPVVERSLAVAAGLGWTGKNTCLIHPRLGSFGFLGVLLTALPVQDVEAPTAPLPAIVPDRCGTCRRCLDACPTNAFIAPYQMDATRCIAYLTIEHKGPIDEELMDGMGRQVFGCDICQDVCPWNRKSLIGADPEPDPDLAPREELVNPALDWLAELDEAEFERRFNGSPVRRSGFNGLRRNIAIALGNAGLSPFHPQAQNRLRDRLREWAESADRGLRAAARWALEKIEAEVNAPKKP
ncbi:MAG: tRNA epoxyqueuosine(34) reductase QueG [Terracidiphilus sp.]